MKKLHEYETPISNEASFARWTNHAGIQCKTETDSVPVVVSRDLERKLAMCQDALREVYNDGKGSEVFPKHPHDHEQSDWVLRFKTVEETLKATEPK